MEAKVARAYAALETTGWEEDGLRPSDFLSPQQRQMALDIVIKDIVGELDEDPNPA